MRTIVLISCVKKKGDKRTTAKDLYISPLFKKALAYAEKQNPDSILILSAKYGLVDQNEVISPYDETLNSKNVGDRR